MSARPLVAALLALSFAVPFSVHAQSQAQSRFAPPQPVEFERVSLRQTVDSCAFNPARVRVSVDGATLKVYEPRNQCLVVGPPEVVDIQLGAFPAGTYRVEVYIAQGQPPLERLDLEVSGIVEPAIYPPPPRPIANYTGLWWSPAESGWGLSLHQGALSSLFGALFVFGAGGAPEWYTLQSGHWDSSTRWSGAVIRSSGPPWVAFAFDANNVAHATVGSASIDFTMLPGQEDRAALTVTIGGATVSKTITRTRL
jgi:hypothetical protein